MNDLLSILYEEGSSNQPVAVLDGELKVFSFNPAAKITFPGITSGTDFSEFATLRDAKRLVERSVPSAAVVSAPDGTAFLATFCPVKHGYTKRFVITLYTSDRDGAYEFMAGKLSVLSKCLAELGLCERYTAKIDSLPRIKADAEAICTELYRCRQLAALASEADRGLCTASCEELLCRIFSYYRYLRFGKNSGHYDVVCEDDTVSVSSIMCILITDAFHRLMEVSADSYVAVNEKSVNNGVCITMSCKLRPESFPTGSHGAGSVLLSAGFEYTDLLFLKKLAILNGWQAEYDYSEEYDELSFSVTFDPDCDNSRIKVGKAPELDGVMALITALLV